MTSSHPLPVACQWFSWLAAALDRRSAPRLALLFLEAVPARGRRTVTTRVRAARLGDPSRPCYTAVAFAPDGASVATTHRGGTIRPWDVVAGRELRRIVSPEEGAWSLVLAPD